MTTLTALESLRQKLDEAASLAPPVRGTGRGYRVCAGSHRRRAGADERGADGRAKGGGSVTEQQHREHAALMRLRREQTAWKIRELVMSLATTGHYGTTPEMAMALKDAQARIADLLPSAAPSAAVPTRPARSAARAAVQ